MIDFGEPACFACGWYNEEWDKAPNPWKLAGETGLQRAHIVPHALGGGSGPDNFVMLCQICHEDSPDWDQPEAMLGWMERRPSWRSREMEIRRWGPPQEWEPLVRVLEVPNWKDKVAEALETHGTSHWSGRGPLLSVGTFKAALAHVLEEHHKCVTLSNG
jgi:hypothetical protein